MGGGLDLVAEAGILPAQGVVYRGADFAPWTYFNVAADMDSGLVKAGGDRALLDEFALGLGLECFEAAHGCTPCREALAPRDDDENL